MAGEPEHDLPAPTVKWALFGWRGRLSRQSYFLAAALILVCKIYILLNIVQIAEQDETLLAAWGFVMIGFWLAAAWAILAMTVKRLHDIGYSGLLAFGLFIPMINVTLIIALMLIRGSQETNAHGPPPFPRKSKQ